MNRAHGERTTELLEKGLQLYGMGDPMQALAAWNEALQLDPGNVRAVEYIKFVSESLNSELVATVADGPAATPATSGDHAPSPADLARDSAADLLSATSGAALPAAVTTAAAQGVAARADDAEPTVEVDIEMAWGDMVHPGGTSAAAPPTTAQTPAAAAAMEALPAPALTAPLSPPPTVSVSSSAAKLDPQQGAAAAVEPVATPPTPSAPALDVAPATAAEPAVEDWGTALDGPTTGSFNTAGAFLSSAGVQSGQPMANATEPAQAASGGWVATAPAAPLTVHTPASTTDPWGDVGDGVVTLETVANEADEFLNPISGEHPIAELVSQVQAGNGQAVAAVVAESALGPSVEIAADAAGAEQCERLMAGARDLFELGDFSGSLELVEKVLAIDEQNGEAQAYLERNQGTLLKMYESRIGSFSQHPRVTIPPDEVIWLNLHHRAGFLLAQIDGSLTYDDLLSLSAMTKIETCKILVQLLNEGVITST